MTKFLKKLFSKSFLVLFLWFGISLICLGFLLQYSSLEGVRAINPINYPNYSDVEFAETRLNLLFFVHPKCPCTRASFNELKKLSSKIKKPHHISVIFSLPESQDLSWLKNSFLYKTTEKIKTFKSIIDQGDKEFKNFNIKTSGHLLIYNPKRKLIFSGGLTASRGHEGDNKNSDLALKSISHNQKLESSVFGCAVAIE